jgi:hypothetical protein
VATFNVDLTDVVAVGTGASRGAGSLRLLGRSEWWLPARLAWLHQRLGLHTGESSLSPRHAMPGVEVSP